MPDAHAAAIAIEQIPVIDVGVLAGDDASEILRVGSQMREASETIGFFYVANHGVPEELLRRAFSTSKAFFHLPQAQKEQVKVNSLHRGFIGYGGAKMVGGKKSDLKESFVWGLELAPDDPDVALGKSLMGPNQWPAFMPSLERDLYAYYLATLDCGRRLLRGIAASLGKPADHFEVAFAKPLARGSAIYYPPQEPQHDADQFGVAPHTDYGGLTLLAQDQVGGLEVRARSGAWVKATPIPGTLVINVGDLLGRWTNDRFHSNAHRVINASGRERQSMATFFDPHYDTVIDPADLLEDRGMARHPPITCGAYIVERFGKVFAYRKA